MRARTAATAVAALSTLAVPSATFASPVTGPTTRAKAQMLRLARETARLNGEASPASIRMVVTTRRAAASCCPHSNPPVFLVQMTGKFSWYEHRQGSPVPTGTVFWFTFDLVAQHILDMGLTRRARPLGKLGTVFTLLP